MEKTFREGDVFVNSNSDFVLSILRHNVINDIYEGRTVAVDTYEIKHTNYFEPYIVTRNELTNIIEREQLTKVKQNTTLVEEIADRIIEKGYIQPGATFTLTNGDTYAIKEKVNILNEYNTISEEGFLFAVTSNGKDLGNFVIKTKSLAINLALNCEMFKEGF